MVPNLLGQPVYRHNSIHVTASGATTLKHYMLTGDTTHYVNATRRNSKPVFSMLRYCGSDIIRERREIEHVRHYEAKTL